MRATKILMSLIALIPLGASAQERARELPSMSELRDSLRDARGPAAVPGAAVARPAAAAPGKIGCPVPMVDGMKVKGRWFSDTRDVKWADGSDFGTLESEGSSRVFKYKDGSVVAKGSAQDVKGGRVITVTGCDGGTIGTITETETDWNGSRAFAVKDASGAEVAKTGSIEYGQDSYILTGAKGPVAKVSDDDAELNVMGAIDGRLVIMVSAFNDAADWRENARRRRERIGDRPGRGDR